MRAARSALQRCRRTQLWKSKGCSKYPANEGPMPDLDWLTERPFAHRGLHDASAGVIENTAQAFAAAISGGYGIETDLQISADGEAMVHHDDALGRLTEGTGRLADMSAADIKLIHFKGSTAHV